MNNSVKSESQLGARFCLFYFFLTIGLIGLLLAYLLCIPLYLLGRLHQPSETLADAIKQKGILFLMSVQPWYQADIDIHIAPLPSKSGVLLVSNHRSTLDVFILLSQVKGIKILAKQALFKIPFLNIVMWASKQIPVPRGQLDSFLQAMAEVTHRLQQGQIIHVFPEMTRCSQGFEGVRNFLAAPFLAAQRAQVPLIPIVIKGTDNTWPKGFWGVFFRRPIQVYSLPPLYPQDFPSVEALKSEVQRKIEDELKKPIQEPITKASL